MTYSIYKKSRDASWQCLKHTHQTALPINPVSMAKSYELSCKAGNFEVLHGASGKLLRCEDDNIVIVCEQHQSPCRQRFTIMHELGHYLLGHLGETPLSRSYSSIRTDEEQAADRFAADVLMPACVLYGLGIHTPDEIARVCCVSMQAATIRAERMAVLYQRDKFFTDQLERDVYAQFSDFIRDYKNGEI